MGKSIPSPSRLQEFAKTIASERVQRPKLNKPISKARVLSAETAKSERLKLKMEKSKSESESGQNRLGLGEVVSDCVKRWFQDTLKEAKAGDSAMQVLVGQMYYSGYGIPRDAQKGRAWISRASKSRSSVWKVSDKHPGYNASDSDSDDVKGDAK